MLVNAYNDKINSEKKLSEDKILDILDRNYEDKDHSKVIKENNITSVIKKKVNLYNKNHNKFQNIKNGNIIDEFIININFIFDKYNIR